MSVTLLNARNTRRAAEGTGLPIVAARQTSTNDLWLVVTDDHRHFTVNRRTWEYEPDDVHWTSCAERFPGYETTVASPIGPLAGKVYPLP